MKVLLIDPPFKRFTGFVNYYFPLGLGYLAAVIREAGFEVAIFDADAVQKGSDIDFSEEYRRLDLYIEGLNDVGNPVWTEIGKILEDFKPDVVGITAMTFKFGSVLRVARLCKDWDPGCVVVVGGPHPTIDAEQVLLSEDVDVAVRGEAEESFVDVLQSLQSGLTLAGIKGISYKRPSPRQRDRSNQHDGCRYGHSGGSDGCEVIHNSPREFMKNLDGLPFPARHLLMNSHNYTSEDMGIVMTSRGCPFNCSYCFHMWQRKVRFRSVDNVIEEIRHVKRTYGTSQFAFKDDSFTVDKRRVLALCHRMVDEKLNINWDCTTRADLLDEDLLKAMVRAGCNHVKIGVETGSQRILDATNKGVTLDQMQRTAELLNKSKVFWSAYFMVGLPMETEEDIMKTYEFMKEIDPCYAGLGVYSAFPSTRLFEVGVDMGLLRPKVELEHFFKVNPKDYFFADPHKRVAELTPSEFDRLVAFLMQRFHRHNTKPNNIIRRGWARRKVYGRDPMLMVRDVKKAIDWMFS